MVGWRSSIYGSTWTLQSVTRTSSIKPSILRIAGHTPRVNRFHPSSETGVKGFFFYFVDCVVLVWFCFNSSVNFVKHFCWLVIINKGCETNRKNVAEAAWKEKCKFGWKLSGPQRKQKAQATCLRDFKKATVTELKGEKDRIRCLFWILARKLSNRTAGVCNFGGG